MPATSEIVSKPPSISINEKIEPKSCTYEIYSHLNLLQVARAHNDRRLVSRVLQHLPEIRRKLVSNILINLLQISSISGKIEESYV